MQTRWPLHPKPRPYETLEKYVRRLAECYGVGYENFCLRALNISSNDSKARQFREPTPELLQRLSHGTGIAIEVLEQMTLECIGDRLMKEATEMLNI